MNSSSLMILTACSSLLAYIEEKCKVPRLYVNFARKKPAAQLLGLLTEERLRENDEEEQLLCC